MVKSYSQFTLKEIENLGITIHRSRLFDSTTAPLQPSELLVQTLEFFLKWPLSTEKAKSELIIIPILAELSRRNPDKFSVYSGYTFDVDKSLGLKGQVDFILSKSPAFLDIKSPIFCIVEAKNENLDIGIPQCIAEMYAAYKFNQTDGNATQVIFGAVTYGLVWRFLRLENTACSLDSDFYTQNELPKLLGVLQHIVDFYK